MGKRILIVGGVAAGASAATRARRAQESAEIIMFERGDYVSFANCGLPYYISGDIAERENLLVVTPELFRKRHNIDVRLKHEVMSIDAAAKTITVKNLADGTESVERYDALILAPGTRPLKPPLPGMDAENVYTMTTIPDADAVQSWIDGHMVKNATVIGAGYIGVEMAEALLERGIKVTLIEKLEQVIPTMDPDMAALMSQHMHESGIRVTLGEGLASIATDENNNAISVKLESGREIETDLVIVSVGVRPNVELAVNAGLELGTTGAIKVDEHMQTSDRDIWAAGDAIESTHLVTRKPVWIALAGPANKQGRAAGCNAAGCNAPGGAISFRGLVGTSIVRFNKFVAGSTGLNFKQATAEGYDFQIALIHAMNHAGYYPGASLLAAKVIYEKKTGRLLGAQVVGEEGVDKRIDVFATAVAGKMTVDDVAELDLAYAPPFGSARDPVIVAGFVAQNQRGGIVESIGSDDLKTMIDNGDDFTLLDVRMVEEHNEMHIPGSILIPIDELRERIGEVDMSKPVVVYCRVGLRGYLGARILTQNGAKVRNLCGGLRSWRFGVMSRGHQPSEAEVHDTSRA